MKRSIFRFTGCPKTIEKILISFTEFKGCMSLDLIYRLTKEQQINFSGDKNWSQCTKEENVLIV